MPKEIAKEAIKANPEKSNRTIAKETGTSLDTVNRARNELGERGRSPERIGQDGKTYRVDAAERAEARCQAQWKAFAAEEERDRKECIALNQKAIEAERELLDAIAKGEAGDACLMRMKAEGSDDANPISGAWERATPKQRKEFVGAWWFELVRLNKSKPDCDQCRKPGADLKVHYGESSAWLHRDCQDAWRAAQDA